MFSSVLVYCLLVFSVWLWLFEFWSVSDLGTGRVDSIYLSWGWACIGFFFGTSPYCRNLLERLRFKSYVKVETPGHGRGYQLLLWRLAFKSIMSLVLWLHQYMTHLNVFKVAELPGLISCWCFSFITMRRVFFQ